MSNTDADGSFQLLGVVSTWANHKRDVCVRTLTVNFVTKSQRFLNSMIASITLLNPYTGTELRDLGISQERKT